MSPFAGIAASALPWATSRAALGTAFTCTLFITVGTFIGAGWFFEFIVLGYLFDIARSTANGRDEMPLPADFRDVFRDMLDPALRLLVSIIWCWGAFSLLGMSAIGASPWIRGALWMISACYVPIALLVAAARAPLLVVANPVIIASLLVRLGWDSLRLAALCAVTFGLYAVVTSVEERFGGRAVFGLFGLNLFVVIPCTMLLTMLAMSTFRAAGLLLRVRGDDVGYGPAEAYLVPVLGATEPRGVLPSRRSEEPSEPDAANEQWLEGTELPAEKRSEVEPNDEDRCTRTLSHLAQRFPQSAEGRTAMAWLQKRGHGK